MLLKLEVKVLSSAKSVNLKNLEHFGKSFMNIRNNRGPSVKIWSPALIEQSREFCPFNDTNWFISVK